METFTIDETFALSRKVHEVAGKSKNNDRLKLVEYIKGVGKEAADDRVVPRDKAEK